MYDNIPGPLIRKTIFHVTDMKNYAIDVDQSTTFYDLKKILMHAAHLSKGSFSIYHEGVDFTTKYDIDSICDIFQTEKQIDFDLKINKNSRSIEEELVSIKLNIQDKCPVHEGKFLSFYCFSCNKGICDECKKNEEHNKHNVKEKYDYLAPAKFLIDNIYSDIASYSPNLAQRQNENLEKFLITLKMDYFGKLRQNLDQLEKMCTDLVNFYIENENITANNTLDAPEELKNQSIDGFIRLKNDINTNKIIMSDNIYLTLNNKLDDIKKYKHEHLCANLVKYEKMMDIFEPLKFFLGSIIESINKIIINCMNQKGFVEMRESISNSVVQKPNFNDLINYIFSNLKVPRLSQISNQKNNGTKSRSKSKDKETRQKVQVS